MKLLLDKGADANEKGQNDFTVLMWAADTRSSSKRQNSFWRGVRMSMQRTIRAVRHLCGLPQKVMRRWQDCFWRRELMFNVQDQIGLTALKRAQDHGNKEIEELLEAHGAKE